MKYQKTVQCMAAAALCAALCISRPLSVLATSQGFNAITTKREVGHSVYWSSPSGEIPPPYRRSQPNDIAF